jgi:putative membrane protein
MRPMPLRLDPVVTATYVVTLSAPVAAYASIRLARLRRFDHHRIVQSVLVVMCWLSVLGLELRIRFAGGAGAFVDRAPPELIAWAHRLLAVHIIVAVATYGLWSWLAVASWRRYEVSLPGRFSRWHRMLGTLVFGGLCFTAASATGMFMIAFVL